MNAIGIVSCVGFAGLLLGWFLTVSWTDGRHSGWVDLGRRYPAGWGAVGAKFYRVNLCLNGRWYRDRAIVRVGGGGVRLGLPPLFRAAHPPVLLPWDDVTAADVSPDGDVLHMVVGQATVVTLVGPAARTAARVLGRSHSINNSST